MTEDPYGDPRLVDLYDGDNPAGADHAWYRTLAAELGARRVLDLGCGTGLLTRSLASPGRTVVGVDPSEAMLDYARRQPGAERVRWVLGGASAIPAGLDADLAVCTGNTIMHLSPGGLAFAFDAIARSLRPGGVIAFETRNPAARAWESWTAAATLGVRDTPFGRLREWIEVTEVGDEGRVVFDAHNVFDVGSGDASGGEPGEELGEECVFTSTLWFRGHHVLTETLTAAGFTGVAIRGGWHDGPLSDTSALIVVRAVRGG